MRNLLAVIAVLWASAAAAQHDHGTNGLPTWYDDKCCNNRDCAPVEDSTISFSTSATGSPIVIYTEVGAGGYRKTFVYEKERWRWSQDERYHACHSGREPLCIYIRPGA